MSRGLKIVIQIKFKINVFLVHIMARKLKKSFHTGTVKKTNARGGLKSHKGSPESMMKKTKGMMK